MPDSASSKAASNARPQSGAALPQPAPALKRLDRFVGTWRMKGRFIGAHEDTITGQTTFHWLDGGFFLQQDVEIDFGGTLRVKSRELIGFDPRTNGFASQVYSNLSPVPLPYEWDVQGDDLTIRVSYGPLDATFTGRFSQDGHTFSGGWRPNPGADAAINVAYDITGTRVT